MDKKYKVSDEMKELMDDFVASNGCRDKAISMVFNTKKAIYYAKRAVKKRNEFWQLVYELYPQLREEGSLSYDFTDQAVYVEKPVTCRTKDQT